MNALLATRILFVVVAIVFLVVLGLTIHFIRTDVEIYTEPEEEKDVAP